MRFVVKQQGKIVARGKTFNEALNKAMALTQPEKTTKQMSQAQLSKLVFDIVEVE